MGEHKRHHPY
ncbi:hypothetical protein RDI58_018036 [Solanum bulbocastanum]|uniref:Uncharacterized protein n=1 Tax=Solanum bulbocastanum TaxID=147425 RepID=A0AAN8TIT5_SOLBU